MKKGKRKRRCPACGVEEKETLIGYTNLAPYSGYCVDCINRAMALIKEEK